jgi:hypothetical protein
MWLLKVVARDYEPICSQPGNLAMLTGGLCFPQDSALSSSPEVHYPGDVPRVPASILDDPLFGLIHTAVSVNAVHRKVLTSRLFAAPRAKRGG